MQCLVSTVLVHGNWDTTTARINWIFCVSKNKLGCFKQQPNEALPKFLGKQGLPGTSFFVASKAVDAALGCRGVGRGWSS